MIYNIISHDSIIPPMLCYFFKLSNKLVQPLKYLEIEWENDYMLASRMIYPIEYKKEKENVFCTVCVCACV